MRKSWRILARFCIGNYLKRINCVAKRKSPRAGVSPLQQILGSWSPTG